MADALTVNSNSRRERIQFWIPFVVVLLILSTAIVQAAVGFNTVLFPVRLEEYGYSKSLIGLCLAFEVGSVLAIVTSIDRIIARIGLIGTILLGTAGRLLMLLVLSQTRSWALWSVSVFGLGLATYLVLISLQTWINSVPLGRFRGLTTGCFSSALSLGTASGPLIFNQVGVAGGVRPFYVSMGLVAFAAVLLLPMLRLVPRIASESRLRLIYVIRMAKIPILSSFVGGVTFFGLPAFLTLYGMMNGLPVQQASLLLTSFMLGSVSLGIVISTAADYLNRTLVTIACVLVGVVCAVYLPLAIYNYNIALFLLFVWGGAAGGIYASGLAAIGSLFRKEDQISANVAYSIMDNVGGMFGVIMIGLLMGAGISDGIVYVIVLTAITYFIYSLSHVLAD